MSEKNCERNRKYMLEKRYVISNMDDMFALDQEIMELTKKSARISVIVGNKVISVHVYCRTNTSKVYRLCTKFGFMEF